MMWGARENDEIWEEGKLHVRSIYTGNSEKGQTQ